MLHHATPSTPNHLPNWVLFEPAGLSFAPMCLIASAKAFCPNVLGLRTIGEPAADGLAPRSATLVAEPTTPSTVSFLSRWNARTAAAVVVPYTPSCTPGA